MSGLTKLAGDLQGVLHTSAEHMVKLANQNAELTAINQKLEHELKAMKLARRMESRGLSPELDYEQKVAQLLATPAEKLSTMEQAVELASGGFRLGTTQTDDFQSSGPDGKVPDPLDTFISSQAAYT